MALPKLNDKPKYELVIPSTKQNVRFRPYLVKEEKILMMAMESEDQMQIFQAIADTIEACVEEYIDKSKLTSFDIEYMFVKIRAKSVGESITITPTCDACEGDNEVKIVLDDLVVDVPESNDVITLNDDINIKMKYPTYLGMLDKSILESKSPTEQTFSMILKCIESVLTEDEIMLFADETPKAQMDFVESLSSSQFDMIRKFIEEMPQVTYDASYECSACNTKHELILKGMNDFF